VRSGCCSITAAERSSALRAGAVGPWSAPIVLLSAAHDPWVACTLVMTPAGCLGSCGTITGDAAERQRRDRWVLRAVSVLNRYTQATASAVTKAGQATIYWIVFYLLYGCAERWRSR